MGVNQHVLDAWIDYTAPLEGCVPWMYQDILGLVTVGYGCLIDPISEVDALCFYRVSDGKVASPMDIKAEWLRVKADPNAARYGHMYLKPSRTLEMRPKEVNNLALVKLASNEKILSSRIGSDKWDSLCPSVQMVFHSIAWAAGPYAKFPRLLAACLSGDWATAEKECTLNPKGNPGLIARNDCHKALMRSAANGNTGAPDWVTFQ